ncbi:potassium transporter Kup [Agromyces binzhouensis]|uniref:Probable potassium transport system protein Kup n=2 Tax=Agromyces binzhouensis TaxID=1817495 RepID=A0A4Q2JU26_9MICO|nr:potassium transporter Kup [Agromyces binzhouensis]
MPSKTAERSPVTNHSVRARATARATIPRTTAIATLLRFVREARKWVLMSRTLRTVHHGVLSSGCLSWQTASLTRVPEATDGGSRCGRRDRWTRVRRVRDMPADVTDAPRTAPSGPTALAAIGALGVVFGDIGTSPLYALSAALAPGGLIDHTLVYGVTSMVVWSITLVVTVLYVTVLMRFDNDGEGGLLALLAQIRRARPTARMRTLATGVAILGAAMFLGDSMITPAISVLSAVEGLTTIDSDLGALVVPITVAILVGLFVVQRFGTARIGRVFGPIMLVWFLLLAVLGAFAVARGPEVLVALSPHWIVLLVAAHPWTAFLALGGVVLAITGAEALFADMGHFGRRPVTIAWLAVVFPCLLLAYLGQAAAVLAAGAAGPNSFFLLVPGWATVPVVILATMATVIASQAVISGAFSAVHQAGRLDLIPSVRAIHTSATHRGQLYLPAVNLLLAAAVIGLVVAFQSSSALASAYGIAVTVTLSSTTTLLLLLLRVRGGLSVLRAVGIAAILGVLLAFLAANLTKVVSGGWVPLGVGVALLVSMWTWWRGSFRMTISRRRDEPLLSAMTGRIHAAPRVPGTTVYLARSSDTAPVALTTLLERYGVLSEHVIVLAMRTTTSPFGLDVETRSLAPGVTVIDAGFGYRQRLRVADALARAATRADSGFTAGQLEDATYVVSSDSPVADADSRLPRWQQRLFIGLERTQGSPVDLAELPARRTLIVGRELPV